MYVGYIYYSIAQTKNIFNFLVVIQVQDMRRTTVEFPSLV